MSIFEVLGRQASQKEFDVNKTVIAINRVQKHYHETRNIVLEIHILIIHTYNSLDNTIDGVMNETRTSLALLDRWNVELEQINAHSMDKVKEIGNKNKTIYDQLETTMVLIIKARDDAKNAVTLFESLMSKVLALQANITAVTKLGKNAYDAARQRYNNASIVFNVTSHLDIHTSNSTRSITKV